MVLPREKRRAIAAIYAFAREVDDVADGDLPAEREARRLEALRASLDGDAGRSDVRRARATRARGSGSRATRSRRSSTAACRISSRRRTRLRRAARLLREGRRRGRVACIAVYGSDDAERAMTLGIALQLINIMRDVDEDRQLGRVYLPQDELARVRRRRARAVTPEFRRADGVPGAARAGASRRGAAPARLARPAQRALRLDLRGSLPRDSSTASRRTASTSSAACAALDAGEARRRRARAAAGEGRRRRRRARRARRRARPRRRGRTR